MTARQMLAGARLGGLVAFCAALLWLAGSIGVEHAGVYGLFVITWIGLIGLNIMFGHGGQFNLAQNTLYAVGAFAYGILATDGSNPWLGLVVATLGGAVAAMVMSTVAGRVRGLGLAILTLGIALATPDLLSAMSLTGGFDGIVGIPTLQLGSEPLLGNDLLVVYTVLALIVFLLSRNWLRSSWGSALHAVAADPSAAAGIGLNPLRYRTLVFFVGGAVIGFAGGLYGSYQGYLGYLSFPVTLVIMWYLGVILGGAGTIWGPIIGAAVITVLPENLPVSDDAHHFIWGALLVGFVVLAPRGVAAGGTAAGRAFVRWTVRKLPRVTDVVRSANSTRSAPSMTVARSRETAGPALHAVGITKRIGGLQILDDVTLSLEAGRVTALLGANGAGKSTLVNCLSGYMGPSSGTVSLAGRDITGAKPDRVCQQGLVRTFQHPRLVPHRTVFENVLVGLHSTDRPRALAAVLPAFVTKTVRRRQEDRVFAVLQELGIADDAMSNVDDLSAGSRQVVSIARSLMTEPSVILLDEPVAGLSLQEMRHVADTIAVVADHGVAVLVIEHRLDFVKLVATDAFCLDSGRLLSEGPLEQVLSDPSVRYSFLGSSEAPVLTTHKGGSQ